MKAFKLPLAPLPALPLVLVFAVLASCSSKSSPPFCGLGDPPPGIGVAIALGAPCCGVTASVVCLGQGEEISSCPENGVVVECLYAHAEAGAPNGGAPAGDKCTPDDTKYTWQKVFTCPNAEVCGGGSSLQSFGMLQCVSGKGPDVPLAGTGGWCSEDGTEACSLDKTEILDCQQGLWTVLATCDCGLMDPNCQDIVCPVGCLH